MNIHIIYAFQFGLEKFLMAYPDTKPTMETEECPFKLRGWDTRTDFQRKRHRGQGDREFRRGADSRKRKNCLSENCPHKGRRGWAKGFCKSCAYKKEYKDPQSATKVSHHKKVKKEVKVKKESKACEADTEPVVKQCKERRPVRFPVRNKQQHGLTDLANDETPISGQDKKNDTTKKQQEPPERAEEEEPVEKHQKKKQKDRFA